MDWPDQHIALFHDYVAESVSNSPDSVSCVVEYSAMLFSYFFSIELQHCAQTNWLACINVQVSQSHQVILLTHNFLSRL